MTPVGAVEGLRLREVHARYGPFRALFGVDLDVPAGRAVALLGPNGAGKTSIARVATGLLAPSAGQVLVGGDDLTGQREWDFARCGVGHVVEGRSVFASLSVEANLNLALRRRVPRDELTSAIERVYERHPRLAERRRQDAGTLSGGEQWLLSLAWALERPPAVLVCDELSLGLAPKVVTEVYSALAEVKASGTALLIIEQEVAQALRLADEVAILQHGQIAYCGDAAQVDAVYDELGIGRS